MKYSEIFGGSGHDTAALPLHGTTNGGLLFSYLAATAAITAGADVWQTVLDVTGRGLLRAAGLSCTSLTTGHTITLRITIDGTAYELARTNTGSSAACKVCIPTFLTDLSFLFPTAAHRFNTALKIEAKRSNASNTCDVGWTHSLDRS